MRILKSCLLLGGLLTLGACTQRDDKQAGEQQVVVKERVTRKGNKYTIFYPQNLVVQVATTRPKAEEERYRLAVAAAYTDLETNQPLDLLVANGRLLQPHAKVGFLNGMLTCVGNKLTISRIGNGQSPAPAQLAQVQRQHGTLLLQELLVADGQNQKPAGGSLFQRRALTEFADHHFAVVESASDAVEMQQFGNDLVELGAKNALYLDMGDWDEGWYKADDKVVALGHRRTETARQSNWLVFVRPAAK